MSIINLVGVCRLGGFIGSNPEVLGEFPANKLTPEQKNEFINKSMPEGVLPGTITVAKFLTNYIVSYAFRLKSEVEGERDDLATVTVLVPERRVNIEHFKQLFKLIMESFKDEIEKVSPTVLSHMIERIYNGVNQNEKIKMDALVIDVPEIIKKQKLRLIKTDLKELKGAFF